MSMLILSMVVSFVFICYIHIFYPALLGCIYLIRKRSLREDSNDSKGPMAEPKVTMVIAAFNEENVIEEKILNTLQLDYPRDKLQIIVFSDGSTDATDEIVRKYSQRGVCLLRIEGRLGKSACQNVAIRNASGEVVVFSDATAIYDKNCIRSLVRPFREPSVGCVAGRLSIRVNRATGAAIAEGEAIYLRMLQWVRRLESLSSMPVGASGAIFAIRKELAVEIPGNSADDLIRPIEVIRQGYKVKFERTAIATEVFGERYNQIFRKKLRSAKRAIISLRTAGELLNPLKYGWFSFQLITKVLLRRLLLPAYLIILASSILLGVTTGRAFYFLPGFGICVFMSLAGLGRMMVSGNSCYLPFSKRMCLFTYYYVLAVTAAFLGILLGMSGRSIEDWQPSRR